VLRVRNTISSVPRSHSRGADPGKTLITGQCSDFNRIKGPILRGLAARAPYFHNGAAADLREPVNFYNQRFSIHRGVEVGSDRIPQLALKRQAAFCEASRVAASEGDAAPR